jgi:hypothetical protein
MVEQNVAAELIGKVGISEQTFHRWKKVYGGLEPGQAMRLKQLEEENRSSSAWRQICRSTVLKRIASSRGAPKTMFATTVRNLSAGRSISGHM